MESFATGRQAPTLNFRPRCALWEAAVPILIVWLIQTLEQLKWGKNKASVFFLSNIFFSCILALCLLMVVMNVRQIWAERSPLVIITSHKLPLLFGETFQCSWQYLQTSVRWNLAQVTGGSFHFPSGRTYSWLFIAGTKLRNWNAF